MASEPCDGCGRDVSIAGGITNLWTFGGTETGGLALELDDGSEFLLCYDCIEALPEAPTSDDVAALDDRTK